MTKSPHDPFPVLSEAAEILVVEDETVARREMSRFLKRKGFRVREASGAVEAIQRAAEGNIAVVLMDIVLGEGPDGIEVAREIQSVHPDTSVIFVSAYASDRGYRERADLDQIRIVGWIEKPIGTRTIHQLTELISGEIIKTAVRASLARARAQGIAPAEHLRALAKQNPSLTRGLLQDILAELGLPEQKPE